MLINTRPQHYIHLHTSEKLSLLQGSSPKGGGWLAAGLGSPGTQLDALAISRPACHPATDAICHAEV